MNQQGPSSTEHAPLALSPSLPDSPHPCLSPRTSPSLPAPDLTFSRHKGSKEKKIRKRPETMFLRLSLTLPHSFNHVFNVLNILGLNERTLRDPTHDQSYFRSMFYIKSVEKVELRRHALIIFTRNLELAAPPVQYLLERYRSFGDRAFFDLADSLQKSYRLFAATDYSSDLMRSYEGEPLSRFIEAMQNRIYMCKVAPNKLVVSRRLLELLGEDMELYGLRLCKYKTPMREIISGESYLRVAVKTVENIGHISEFLQSRISFEQLQDRTALEFNDYLYTRQQKKLYCKFSFHMPTPLINCVELVQQLGEYDGVDPSLRGDPTKRRRMERECVEQRYLQAETLKHLTSISDSLLLNNRKRLAGYCLKEEATEFLLS